MTSARSSTFSDPFTRDLAITHHPDDSAFAIELPFEKHNTMYGLIHGGALASLVPISTFAAIRAGAEPPAELCTVSLHVEYVRAARKHVIARATSVRRVRELEFFNTRMEDADGQTVAFASSAVSTAGLDGSGAQPSSADPASFAALAPLSQDTTSALQEALAASPYLSRRGIALHSAAAGALQLSLPAAEQNLDGRGDMHEGAALSLIDAAGATVPWTIVPATAGAGGATIALHVQLLSRMPARDLMARAVVRAHSKRIHWVDVSVSSRGSERLHALGTVVYRFNEVTIT